MRIGIAFLLFYLMLFNSINAQCPCSTTNELQCAANYLASKGILDNGNNIDETANIIRQDLAKVSFIGLYGSASATTPADSFPTPFADLQGNWIEYYKYAKALSYLELRMAFLHLTDFSTISDLGMGLVGDMYAKSMWRLSIYLFPLQHHLLILMCRVLIQLEICL